MTKHGLPVLERIALWSMPEPNSGCTIWFGSLDEKGYGNLTLGKRTRKAHQVVYEEFYGPVPEGCEVTHSCDVRCCVNELHLVAQSHAANMAESSERKRYPERRGERSTQAKLSHHQARYIKHSKTPPTLLAAQFGVTYGMVWRIQRGKNWKHL